MAQPGEERHSEQVAAPLCWNISTQTDWTQVGRTRRVLPVLPMRLSAMSPDQPDGFTSSWVTADPEGLWRCARPLASMPSCSEPKVWNQRSRPLSGSGFADRPWVLTRVRIYLRGHLDGFAGEFGICLDGFDRTHGLLLRAPKGAGELGV